jgi:hypothetical protein
MKDKTAYLLLDKQVSLTMLLVGVIALAVLAFRAKSNEPCQPVSFSYSALSFYTGSPIHFKADIQDAKNYAWDFGDNSKPEKSSATTTHVYQKPGKYTVALVLNGGCEGVRFIDIKEAPLSEDNEWRPQIYCPDTAVVFEPIRFQDMTPDATSWEWRFGETGRVDAVKKNAVYAFKSPGIKTIHLIVNGRLDKVASHVIYIREATDKPIVSKPDRKRIDRRRPIPETPVIEIGPLSEDKKEIPEVPKPREISNDEMIDALKDVVEGKKGASDFSEYVNGNLSMMVVYNGETMTLQQMCNELHGIKKRGKIKKMNVIQTKDGLTGRILTLNVVLQKKKFLGVL